MTSSLDPLPILGPGGAIARRLPGYEPRQQQLKMAQAVAQAIDSRQHLMVEAGTGVGKSFAYLVPAILAASEMGLKVVVSTHTIHLQEQLLNKDIPFLRAVMPQEFTAVLVKGRGNYISLRRLEAARARADAIFPRVEDLDQLSAIQMWSNRTDDGSLSDLSFRPSGPVWDAVASENGNCLGKKCPTYNDCFYYKARRRIASANLLVVNHALFITDLALREEGFSILPEYDLALFDEAHTLEAVAGEHLGLKVSNTQVDYLLNKLYNERSRKGLLTFHALGRSIQQLQNTRTAAENFFANVADWQRTQGAPNGRLRKPAPLTDVLGAELRRLATLIRHESDKIEPPEQRIELEAVQK